MIRTLLNRNGWLVLACTPKPAFGRFEFSDGYALHLGVLLIDRWRKTQDTNPNTHTSTHAQRTHT